MEIFLIFVGVMVVIAVIRVSNRPGHSKETKNEADAYWTYSGDGGGDNDGGGSDSAGFDGGDSGGGGDSSSGF